MRQNDGLATRSLLPLSIDLEVLLRYFLAGDEAVVLLCRDEDTLLPLFQFEEGNEIILHELGSDRSTNQGRELGGADCDILFDLDNIDRIISALCLNREYVVRTSLVESNVYLVCFHLS